MKTSTFLFSAVLGLSACGAPNGSAAQDPQPEFVQPNRTAPSDATAMKVSFAPVVQAAAPAVVNIATRGQQVVRDPFFEFFNGGPATRETGSIGSGVIVRSDGIVVTNTHVVQGMSEIRVILHDRREFSAVVLLADQRSDIAVLKLEGVSERLPVLPIDDQEEQQVGDLVLAIGNPFGVGQTVTNGIISALNRTDTGISDSGSFIQTDAAINPGNSGGALVDMDGDLIGINTAIFSRTGSSTGVGFAVPAVMVRRVVDSALQGDRVLVRPWLGVKGESVDGERARSLGMDRPRGLLITEIWPGGPAAGAGLRTGDVVTAVDGQAVNDQGGLNFRIAARRPDDQVRVEILRDGRAQVVTARVQPLPGDADPRGIVIQEGLFAGVQVVALNPALADRLGGDPFLKGMLVTGVSGRSYAARNFTQNDLILQVNGREIDSAQALREASAGRGPWEVSVLRRGRLISGRIR